MDFQGLVIGFLSFFTALIFVFFLLVRYDLNRPSILKIVMLSALGHFVGGVLYYYYNIHVGADSGWYFVNATTTYTGTGYFFALFILGYLKLFLVGDSILGAFLFFASLGFLGSVFYLLTYKILLDRLSDGYRYFLVDPKILLFPALLLLCWPSYFFWSAGLVKDSFAFLSIGIFLFFFAQRRINIFSLSLLLIASLMGFLVRPYLFIIIVVAGIIFVLMGSKWNMFAKIGIIVLITCIIALLMPVLQDYGRMVHGGGDTISSYVIRQQTNMSIGTSIPVPTRNPYLIFLFVPYLIFANLFLPLFIGARNLLGMVGSFENLYLLWLVVFFYKNRKIWSYIKNKIRLAQFFMLFFLVGMGCLGIMCTNLGLGMREKMMYVPAFLILVMLVYAYKRILVVQYFLSKQAESR